MAQQKKKTTTTKKKTTGSSRSSSSGKRTAKKNQKRLTLVILFSFQGETILANPLHILLIAVPLIVQTILIFFVAYGWSRYLKLPHDVAAPAGMIGASNFFELAVAVAIALFGTTSAAALATTVGVLTEVPVMLFLVRIANKTKKWFQ